MSTSSYFFPLLKRLSLIILILSISYSPVRTNNEEKWEAALDENEKLALDAIKHLHRQLDDDKDGNINLDESNEYLREELNYKGDYEKRQKVFHRNNDNQVSVRELWETWVKSEVHNWTVDQTIEWLTLFVGLPQYSPVFVQNSINGTFLPRLAVNHQQFLSNALGVKDMIHKQKVSLKAQDVVLFGPPKEYTNYVKDGILTSLLVIALAICWNVSVRYKSSQRELSKVIKDMEGLAKAEKELQDLQNIMEKNKMEQEELSKQIQKSMSQKSFADLELPDDEVREEIYRLRSEVEVLRNELQRAEVELQDKCWVPPPALQHWLQLTYELELKTYNRKKKSAEGQLRQAKDACEKLKKKRSSLIGAFYSTHGRSIDDVDKAILEAKGSLTEITHELQERMHRWKQIEILANCPIMNNPGLPYLETVLKGYGKGMPYGGPGSVISNSHDDMDDDAASSIYCPSAVHKLVSTSTCLMFPAGPPPNAAPPYAYSSSRRSSCQQSSAAAAWTANGPGNTCIASSTATLLDNNPAVLVSRERIPATARCHRSSAATMGLICPDDSETLSSSTESEDTVSAPATLSSIQHSMPRSRSTGNMQSLRSGGAGGREPITRDSSLGDEDNMPTEASDMVPGRVDKDRRVTFGIRPEKNRALGENIPIRESNGFERKPNISNLPNPSENTAEGDHSEEESRSTNNFHSTEKPDLIKLVPYPPEAEDKSNSPVQAEQSISSPAPQNTSNGSSSNSTKPDTNENGTIPNRRVRFSEKVKVLRSISRLVSQSRESLKDHKHYKVHASEKDKLGQEGVPNGGLAPVGEGDGKREVGINGINETALAVVVVPMKKPKTRLFSSFRSKKKPTEEGKQN